MLRALGIDRAGVNDPEGNPGAYDNQEEQEEELNDEEARLACKVETAEGEIILC
jgi:hypothetical protein